jgi:hypothetical protein
VLCSQHCNLPAQGTEETTYKRLARRPRGRIASALWLVVSARSSEDGERTNKLASFVTFVEFRTVDFGQVKFLTKATKKTQGETAKVNYHQSTRKERTRALIPTSVAPSFPTTTSPSFLLFILPPFSFFLHLHPRSAIVSPFEWALALR